MYIQRHVHRFYGSFHNLIPSLSIKIQEDLYVIIIIHLSLLDSFSALFAIEWHLSERSHISGQDVDKITRHSSQVHPNQVGVRMVLKGLLN